MMTSPLVPLETQALVPLRIQSSPSRTAWVRSDAASEPASGSESAKVPEDHLGGERVVDAEHDGDRRIHEGDLLERDEVGQRVEPESVVFFRNHHPEKTQLAELGYERRLEEGVAVPLRGERRDLGRREIARDCLNGPLIFGKRREGPSHR